MSFVVIKYSLEGEYNKCVIKIINELARAGLFKQNGVDTKKVNRKFKVQMLSSNL